MIAVLRIYATFGRSDYDEKNCFVMDMIDGMVFFEKERLGTQAVYDSGLRFATE